MARGGARTGAGRKPRQPDLIDVGHHVTPLEFLLAVMNKAELDMRLRLDAAKSAAIYVHAKACEVGIKEEKQNAAKSAGRGKYAAATPPKLATVLNMPKPG